VREVPSGRYRAADKKSANFGGVSFFAKSDVSLEAVSAAERRETGFTDRAADH
jgi:hypothetical protein